MRSNRILSLILCFLILFTSQSFLTYAQDKADKTGGDKEIETLDIFYNFRKEGEEDSEEKESSYLSVDIRDIDQNQTFREILNGLDREDSQGKFILKNRFKKNNTSYLLKDLEIELETGENICIGKDYLDLNLKTLLDEEIENLEKLIEEEKNENEEGTKKYYIALSRINKIKINYNFYGYEKTFKFNIFAIDKLHKNLGEFNREFKELNFVKEEDIDTVDLEIELTKEGYIFTALGKDSKSKIIERQSSSWKLPYSYSALDIYLNNTKIPLEENKALIRDLGLEKDYELKVEMNSDIEDYYGRLTFKNLHNDASFIRYFKKNTEGKLFLDINNLQILTDEAIDVDDLINCEYLNREENTDENIFMYNDRIFYSLKDNKNLDDLIERILGTNYKKEGKEEFSFELKNKSINKTIYFDYQKRKLDIIHKSSQDEKMKTIELMPETRYMYIKPQGQGKIEGMEADKNGYYEIDLNQKEKIEIIYEKDPLDIEILNYQVQNIEINRNGKEIGLNSPRDFLAYKGSMLAVQPINQHNYEGGDINIGGKRFADYKNKFIKIDEEVQLLGYGEQLDNLNNNITELIDGNLVKFRFIDNSSVLYKIVHRTAFGPNYKEDSDYDLALDNKDISKYNLAESRYYVVPKSSLITINPVDVEKKLPGYKLIKSKKVGGVSEDPVIDKIEKEGQVNQIFLGNTFQENLDKDAEFIFSYALKYKQGEIDEKENINFDYKAQVFSDGEFLRESSHPMSYPRFTEDSEVILPFKNIYTCHKLKDIRYKLPQAIKHISFHDKDGFRLGEIGSDMQGSAKDLGIKDLNDIANISILIKETDREDEDNDFFPKVRNIFGEENFISLIYEEVQDQSCSPVSVDTRKLNIKARYKINGDIKEVDLYTNSYIKGSIAAIEKSSQQLVIDGDSSKLYQYIPYEINKKDTGITDKDGNHISVEVLDKWGNKLGDKKSHLSFEHNIKYINMDSDKTFYINYGPIEISPPKLDIFEDDNYFRKKFYYVPFSYFSQDLEENIWDMLPFETNTWTCSTKKIVPGFREEYAKKYKRLLNSIDEYYAKYSKKTKDNLLEFYQLRKINKERLEAYKEKFDIYKYQDWLYELKTNAMDQELIEELEKEINVLEEFKDYKLVDYLREVGIPIEYIANKDDIYDVHMDYININWKNPYLGSRPIRDIHHRYHDDKVYEDLVSKEKVIETLRKTTRYSKIPICISKYKSVDIVPNIVEDFLTNPLYEDTSEFDRLKDLEITKDMEKGREVPIIYLERENLCKEERRIPLEEPSDNDISLKIEYYTIEKDDKKSKIIEKEKFFEYKFSNLPKFMVDCKIGWKISNFENQGFKYYEDGEYEVIDGIKWSKPILAGDKNVVKFYYYPENTDKPSPELETSNIIVNGIDIDKKDKNLYRYSLKGIPLSNEVEIYPYNLEEDGYYLLTEDGDLVEDYTLAKKMVKAKEEDTSYIYYYKYVGEPRDLIDYSVHYLDNQGKPIAKSEDFRFVKEDTLGKIIKKAKEVSGYLPAIEKKSFETNNGEINLIAEDGYEIISEENKFILEKSGKKVLVLDKTGSEARIEFYYDKEENPSPPILPQERVFTFDANGGKINNKDKEVLIITSGAKVKAREDVKRKGYKFLGWTRDKDGNKFFDFNTIINKDMTVYAKWEKDKVESGKLNKRDHIEYIQGYVDGSVRPNANISKQEVAAAFYRLLDKDYKDTIYITSNKFKDVPENLWSNRHISTLANGDILKGYPDGNFRPRNHISRAELAVIVSRFIGFKEADHNFDDIRGHWAEEEIASAIAQGLFIGHEDGNFRPSDKLTRAEFVTVVNRLLERGVDRDRILDGIKTFTDLKEDKWYYTDFVEATNGHIYDLEHFQETGKEIWLELKDFNQDDMFSIK